jgi:hypothetical protein
MGGESSGVLKFLSNTNPRDAGRDSLLLTNISAFLEFSDPFTICKLNN